MTAAQVVETSVTVNNSTIQDYLHTTLVKTSWDTEETRHKDALC